MNYIVKEIDLKNQCRPLRHFKFPIDPNGSFDYKSRTAINAFAHSVKQRNYKPKFKDASVLYYFQGEEDWQITKECFIKTLGFDPNGDKEIIECASIFEFFKVIGYNNKTKKWE